MASIRKSQSDRSAATPVSYTHLTLPTNHTVQISVVAVKLKKKKKYHTHPHNAETTYTQRSRE